MKDTPHARFEALHGGAAPLLLPNAWDAASARLWEEAGASAVATSSAAVAWALGHADGGALPSTALLASVERIVRVCHVPVSVDIEDGYACDPEAVAALAAAVAAAGAAGINIEDGEGTPGLLVDKIRAIRQRLDGSPLFINARTDVYLRGLTQGADAVALSIQRLSLYREAGADGGFVPGLVDESQARAISSAVPLAINLMALPGMPSFAALHDAGVRRISMGPALFRVAYGSVGAATRTFLQGDPSPAFASDSAPGYDAMNRLFAR